MLSLLRVLVWLVFLCQSLKKDAQERNLSFFVLVRACLEARRWIQVPFCPLGFAADIDLLMSLCSAKPLRTYASQRLKGHLAFESSSADLIPYALLHITDPDLNKFHKVVGLFEYLSYSVCTYSSIFWFKMLVGNSFQRPHFSLRIFLNVEKTYTYFP